MNSDGVNLHYYCSNFANLHIFSLTDISNFGLKYVILIYFSILHCLMQMLKSNKISINVCFV